MDHLQAVNTLAIERYLLDEMPREERDSFEEHFFSCAECAEDARVAATMRDGAAAGLARHECLSRGGSGCRAAVPSADSGLARVGGAAVGCGRDSGHWPGLSDDSGTVDDAPSRRLGCVDAVDAASGQPRPGSRGHGGAQRRSSRWPWTWEERSSIRLSSTSSPRADGKRIASGEAPAAVAGAPLLLMLSGSALKGSDRYVLTLKGEREPLTLAPYRFRVKAP